MPEFTVSEEDYKSAMKELEELDEKIAQKLDVILRASGEIEHLKGGQAKCRATIELFWFEHGDSEKSKCHL